MNLVANIVGARPQFIKAGPVSKALRRGGAGELLIHTGQHYDPLMSEQIMRDIGLREPDVNLGIGSGSHGVQTAGMLAAIEGVLLDRSVDAVIVYGDTNTTLAGALAATKLGILTAHVEAGLRSFNRRMPEEINRIVTDHVSDLLFAPTETAMKHLVNEGLIERAALTGDVMVDALNSIDFGSVALPDWARGRFYVATIHRPENTDDETRLRAIIDSLDRMATTVHLLAHPRLKQRLVDWGIGTRNALTIHEPLAYAEMLATVRSSRGLFTDSGGLQKEAYILHVPCVTIRSETEWPETFMGGWNVLGEPDHDMQRLMDRQLDPPSENAFGDGHAAERIVDLVTAAST